MKSALLVDSHPSAKCDQAWFLFAIGSPISKLFLVEAKNNTAVQVLERLVVIGTLSPKCTLLIVHRDCDIGIRREDLVEVVSYVDFILDMTVKMEEFIVDPAFPYFMASLSAEEKAYAIRKVEQIQIEPAPATKPSNPRIPSSPPQVNAGVIHEKVSAALIGLGFNKSRVKEYMSSINNVLASTPIQDLIRRGIQEMT